MRTLIHATSRRWGFSPLGWLRNTWRMRNWLRALKPDTEPSTGKRQRIGVVIAPWLDTSVPWFALAVGLMLSLTRMRTVGAIIGSPAQVTLLGSIW